MIVSAPMNEKELRNLMYTAQLDSTEYPFVIRYPRGEGAAGPHDARYLFDEFVELMQSHREGRSA